MSDKFDKIYNEAIGSTLRNIGSKIKTGASNVNQAAHKQLLKYGQKQNLPGARAMGNVDNITNLNKTARGNIRQAVAKDVGGKIKTGYNKVAKVASGMDKFSTKLGGDPRSGQSANILTPNQPATVPAGQDNLAKVIGKFHTNPQALFTNPQFSQWAAQATPQQKNDFINALITMTKPQTK